jgi:hypothetical protein
MKTRPLYEAKRLEKDRNMPIVKKVNGTEYRLVELDGGKRYEVFGGSSRYMLRRRDNGDLTCTCPGFRYNGRCKHQTLAPVLVKRLPLATMQHMGKQILEVCTPAIARIEICGSVRRQLYSCKDLDFVVLTKSWSGVHECLEGFYKDNWKVGKSGPELISGHVCSIPVDFTRVSEEREWPFMTLYRTGSKETNIRMRGRAKGWGWKLNERGLFDESGTLLECEDERDIFLQLDMQYLIPSER